ncbi:hypothetical protein, partial [Ottowia sp.]|uniref:hypothetical protein n=1 Tax=Ottowia sp. TaxID=1898956 RepID=UPI003A8BC359
STGSSQAPTAAVDNSAPLQPACSLFISRGKSVQTSGATSDCIDALTNSSCLTLGGGNVTAGGTIWGVPAVFFTAWTLGCTMMMIYRRWHARRKGGCDAA